MVIYIHTPSIASKTIAELPQNLGTTGLASSNASFAFLALKQNVSVVSRTSREIFS